MTNLPVFWFFGHQFRIKQRSLNPQTPDSTLVAVSFLGTLKQFVFLSPLKKANHAVMHQEIQWHVIKHVSAF
jgi:hypothetical protein